jgi:hypothetical protein
MTARKPLWSQAGSTSAEEDRALITALYGPVGGVVMSTDLLVTQNGTPNMSVNVAAGRCVVVGTENATMQGDYVGWLDAVLNVAISASDPTNGRIDLIVAKFQDAQYSGATNAFSVVAVTGVASGSPVAPAAPANSIILAQISVAATSTTVLTAAITDKRGPIVPVPSVGLPAVYPAAPLRGSEIYRISNDVAEGPELFDGTAWRLPWNMPWGCVGTPFVSTTFSQAVTSTTPVDLTAISVTWVAVANRRYRVTASGLIVTQATNVSTAKVWITTGAGALLANICDLNLSISGTGQRGNVVGTYLYQGLAAGSQTVKLQAQTSAITSTVTQDSTTQVVLMVEDIGPNGAPS